MATLEEMKAKVTELEVTLKAERNSNSELIRQKDEQLRANQTEIKMLKKRLNYFIKEYPDFEDKLKEYKTNLKLIKKYQKDVNLRMSTMQDINLEIGEKDKQMKKLNRKISLIKDREKVIVRDEGEGRDAVKILPEEVSKYSILPRK